MLQNCVWDFIIVTIEHYTEFIEKRTPVHSTEQTRELTDDLYDFLDYV